jgi:hypothetical protein
MRSTLLTRALALALAAVMLVAAGCGKDEPARRLTKNPHWNLPTPSSTTSTITGPDTTQPRTPGADSQPGTDASVAESTVRSVTVRTDPRDNGAPIDPCTILSVDDLPDSIRPAQDIAFREVPQEPDSAYQVACSLFYSVDALDPDTRPDENRFLAVFVSAGAEPTMSADLSRHRNADAATWGGRPGVRKLTIHDGVTMCDGFVPVGAAGGVAGISVANTLEPTLESCHLLNSLMTTLVGRAS